MVVVVLAHCFLLSPVPPRSAPPTHGVIINTSTVSIFHTVCPEKATELELLRVESKSAGMLKKISEIN